MPERRKQDQLSTEALTRAIQAEMKIDGHEELCALRYEGINKQLGWLIKTVVLATVGLITTLITISAYLYDALASVPTP